MPHAIGTAWRVSRTSRCRLPPRPWLSIAPLAAAAGCVVDRSWQDEFRVDVEMSGVKGGVVHRYSIPGGCGDDEPTQEFLARFDGAGTHLLELAVDSPAVLAGLDFVVWSDADGDQQAGCHETGWTRPFDWLDGFPDIVVAADEVLSPGGAAVGCDEEEPVDWDDDGSDDDAWEDDDSWEDDDTTPDDDTAPAETPLGDPSEVLGDGYVLAWSSFTFGDPPGLSVVLASLLPDLRSLLSPLELAPEEGTARLLVGGAFAGDSGEGSQDLCVPTAELIGGPPDGFADPRFAVQGTTLPSRATGLDVHFADVTLTGTFADGGAAIEGVAVSGTLDTRLLAPFLTPEDPDGVCDLLAVLGVACGPCPSDDSPHCLDVGATGGAAPRAEGLVPVGIDPATAEANAEAGTCG